MRYFSMFSGIGGFELGIQNAYRSKDRRSEEDPPTNEKGRTGLVPETKQDINPQEGQSGQHINDGQRGCEPACVGYCEIDKYAVRIYQRHFPGHQNYGDATKIRPEELPNFELLAAGFPCQSFSIAGKRLGFSDTRGTMFFEIARIVRQKQPRLLLLENVKGILHHDQGKTFAVILSTLDELGYDVQWQIINSSAWVPQNRERIFIIGHLRGTHRPEVFPIERGRGKSLKELTFGTNEASRVYATDGIARTIKNGGGMGAKTGLYAVKGDLFSRKNPQRQKGINPENMFTLRSAVNHGVTDGMMIRRLTPVECERLQGFPDGYTEEGIDEHGNKVKISDAQRYKVLGNAITVPVVEEIITRMI